MAYTTGYLGIGESVNGGGTKRLVDSDREALLNLSQTSVRGKITRTEVELLSRIRVAEPHFVTALQF